MPSPRSSRLWQAYVLLCGLLILKVTASVLLGYRDYFPPNFTTGFLQGRQATFAGSYQTAFYAHLASGPATLLLGLLLVSDRFRQRYPAGHRALGKIQGLLVLLLLVPSGLWMARFADTGAVAAAGFTALAVATGICVLIGWRRALQRRFADHRVWMWRCFLLLCSAVVIRLMGGFVSVTSIGSEWSYPLAAWASWLVPLIAFEATRPGQRRLIRSPSAGDQSAVAGVGSSLPAIEINARRVAAGVSSAKK